MADLALTTSEYTFPGTYVGEILQPSAANLSANARVTTIVAKGNRLAQTTNAPIIRAFLYGVQLSFSKTTPFIAILPHLSTGSQQLPNRLYKQDGTVLRQDQWKYLTNTDGKYASIQIRDDAFDPLATWYLDYQSSDRSVLDAIPVPNIRQINAVGNQLDRPQFVNYKDFFIPVSFTPVTPDASNVHNLSDFTNIAAYLQPGSTGTAAFAAAADYSHPYDRNYTLTVQSATGSPGSRLVVMSWAATASVGNAAAPSVPLLAPLDLAPTFTLDETNFATLQQTLEYGIVIDFGFGASNFVVGDYFTFTALGPAVLEEDSRYSGPQFPTVNAPFLLSGTAGDFQIKVDVAAAYNLLHNNNYQMKLVQLTGSAPNRVFSFVWERFGEMSPATGSFQVNENNNTTQVQTLSNGVVLDFIIGAASPAVGSIWQCLAEAPQIFYTALDSRTYTMNVGSVVLGTTSMMTGSYTTNTTEGGFGNWSVMSGPQNDGYFLLPNNISLAARNLERFASMDTFTFGLLVSGFVNWDLNAQVTDVIQTTSFLTDMNGNITGTAGQTYVILNNIPSIPSSIEVINYNTAASISFNYVVGTPYLYFTVNPNVPIKVTYQTYGAEPDPGQTYYLSAYYLRPDSMYNNPFLCLRLIDGRAFAAPSTVDNDLYIANEIAWANNPQAVYLVQPKNADGSGNYTIPDFSDAIVSLRAYPRATDICLINYIDALSVLLEENLVANDPFQARLNLLWVGLPIGTPIGDVNTQGSIVNYAQSTLQVAGNSAAKGTRILVGPNTATKTITLATGQTATVTLDGSFIAVAGAALVSQYTDPAQDILNVELAGLDTITLFTAEQNKILGQAQALYINGSNGVYTWGEDYTVDPDKTFNQINVMTQRQYVTQVVTRNMNSLIGIVPNSAQAAEQLIRGQLSSILKGLVAAGTIAQYQDSAGNVRNFDPQKDIVVFADPSDDTKFYFNYAWYSRNTIKRLFGLYALNNNDFSTGVALK
jgi:hypothetical protein